MTTFIFRILLGILFIAAGTYHFVNPDFYVRIMPPYLPWHLELVLISGAAEIILGLMVFVPRLAVPARWGLIALLVAVFPANIHMAVHPEAYPEIPLAVLWGRLPLQAVFVAWVWWVTRRPERG
ncbi:DoxX family protein [Zavarzinella formosa]|uniref:DoxX family protein n=1 Tax=Zavarzinella formosa TaxID=360055 RepID=UPI0002DF6058